MYNVVMHTVKRGQEGNFIVRVFSDEDIAVENVSALFSQVIFRPRIKPVDENSFNLFLST